MLNFLRFDEFEKEDLKTISNLLLEKHSVLIPLIKQVDEHKNQALHHYRNQGIQMVITAQDRSSHAIKDYVIGQLISEDINKTSGLPKTFTIFNCAKVMLR